MTLNKKPLSTDKTRSGNPDPVDVNAGVRLKIRRNLIGLSQGDLGKASGLTFQQIQKYERGTNRMSASRLKQFSNILSVPVSYFFDEMPTSFTTQGFAESKQESLDIPEHVADDSYDLLQRRETIDLIRAYYKIQDPKQRRKVFELIRSMSDETDSSTDQSAA